MKLNYKNQIPEKEILINKECYENDLAHLKYFIKGIIDSKKIPSSEELEMIFKYCKESCVDEIGVYLYLFNLSFLVQNNENQLKIAEILIKLVHKPSFNSKYFMNVDCINILVDHILKSTFLAKYAELFLIALLYSNDSRQFLKQTSFFSLFKVLNPQEINEIINAFYSYNNDIDQSLFDLTHNYIILDQYDLDDHKCYRYLLMLLGLCEKNIIVNNLNEVIYEFINSKALFINEIVIYLIPYSSNPNIFFDYLMNCLSNQNECIIHAAIHSLFCSWSIFTKEQKKLINKYYYDNIEEMSYVTRKICLHAICDINEWTIFDQSKFIDIIIELIINNDDADYFLPHIYNLIIDDSDSTEFKISVIQSIYLNLANLIKSTPLFDSNTQSISYALIQSITESLK